jgi:hypothetical protein
MHPNKKEVKTMDILTLTSISAGGLAAIGGLLVAAKFLYHIVRVELLPFRGGAQLLLLSLLALVLTAYLFALLFGIYVR